MVSHTGQRNHKITINRLSTVDPGNGLVTESSAFLCSCWASKKVPNQVRALLNGIDTMEGTVIWNVRFLDCPVDGFGATTIDKTCRITDDYGQNYEITSVAPNERIELQIISSIHK